MKQPESSRLAKATANHSKEPMPLAKAHAFKWLGTPGGRISQTPGRAVVLNSRKQIYLKMPET